jgi:hypothetical protein
MLSRQAENGEQLFVCVSLDGEELYNRQAGRACDTLRRGNSSLLRNGNE